MKRDQKIINQVLERIITNELPYLEYQSFYWCEFGDSQPQYNNWDENERYNIELMIRDGYLRIETLTGAPHQSIHPDDGDPASQTFIYPTTKGHELFESKGVLKRACNNIVSNIPTIIVSVIVAILTAWALKNLGLN